MSRLIIKNLPNNVKTEHLKEIFSEKGEVTDVQLKYTKEGKFRNFGFVGYRTEEQAKAAKDYFNGTFIKATKIDVQFCANLGDGTKPRAWSKYACDSTAFKKIHNINDKQPHIEKKEKKTPKDKIKDLLKKHKDDPHFAEFIEAHVNEKTGWLKEIFEEISKNDEENDDENSKIDDDNPKYDDEKNIKQKKCDEEAAVSIENKAANKQISDLDYMKILMKKVNDSTNEEKVENKDAETKKIRNRPLFYIKISGLPFKCKKKDIKKFFKPLVPYTVRFPLSKSKKLAGFCYVGFRTENEIKKALSKDKLFIGIKRIRVQKYEDKGKIAAEEEEQNFRKKSQEKTNSEESIGESGTIFVRNLPYVVSELEVKNLFEKYGPLAEIDLPVDKILRQQKGFATVTFVMPEHAVKAYTELDGTSFCGRMLHLLPARTEKPEDVSDDVGLSFREKKAKKLKDQAKSSHNWNTLFLDPNAVADVMAANYNTTKEQILDDSGKRTSAAVSLALGETELIKQTREFLENNGVYLDAFNNPSPKRSTTCILVKNLPANTDKDEIKSRFEKCGQLARFVMPKHGITALVDFIEPFEAKKAFNKLAYSRFKSAPLYLEWAPENVFVKNKENKSNSRVKENNIDTVKNDNDINVNEHIKTDTKENKKRIETKNSTSSVEEHVKEENVDDNIGEPENDATLFVKNLNFQTNEEALRNHFSTCGKLHNVTIAKKKDPKNPGQLLSMGYGFVKFYKNEHANEALKSLQGSMLDGKTLELKRSERGKSNEIHSSKRNSQAMHQNGTKILVRNIPFQANKEEIFDIFRTFGQVKSVRLPNKITLGSVQHRGFAFVDFLSKTDAKAAFDMLCQSTHLYGRRLVLEWADKADGDEDISEIRKRTAASFDTKTVGGKKSKKAAVDVETFVEGEVDE